MPTVSRWDSKILLLNSSRLAGSVEKAKGQARLNTQVLGGWLPRVSGLRWDKKWKAPPPLSPFLGLPSVTHRWAVVWGQGPQASA